MNEISHNIQKIKKSVSVHVFGVWFYLRLSHYQQIRVSYFEIKEKLIVLGVCRVSL